MPGAEVCLERNFELPAETKRTQPRVASARENSPALSFYRSDKNELDRLRRVPPRGVFVGALAVTLPCALLSLNGQEAYKSSAPPRGGGSHFGLIRHISARSAAKKRRGGSA
jgi:hypothetical protein